MLAPARTKKIQEVARIKRHLTNLQWTGMILRNLQASFGSQATGFEPLRVLLTSRVRAWDVK
jgi:hypothetical protein